MAVRKSKSGNIVYDLQQMVSQGKNPKVFATLFENQSDFSLLEKVLKEVEICVAGVIDNEKLLRCRHTSMHEKIKYMDNHCGYEKYTLETVKLLGDKAEEVIIVVNNKFSFLYKIVNVLEEAGVNCLLYHISDLKHKIVKVNPINGHLPEEENCSGCAACVSVCPKQAIAMEYGEKGFLIPVIDEIKCIDCKLCTKTCPSLNPIFVNEKEPKFYSFCASDEIRKESSSGGMFTLLAEYVLGKNGYVCGAAFDEDMKLKHSIVNDESGLNGMRGSKYLQSTLGDCYKDVKKLLEEGEYVLFTGTPCQVAGMKAFLKKDYDTLITTELLCHGVPSQKFFDAYLEEIADGRKVTNVEFRSKRLGWSYSGMIIHYEDGSEEIRKWKASQKNAYCAAFIDNMMMRDICYDCLFNDYPRQADFTIGDLWHADELDPKSNDRKGTSFVFVNNQSAEKIFEDISLKAKYYKLLEVKDYAKIPNRVTPKTKVSPYRERFLRLLQEKSFSDAYEYAVNGRFDIGMPCVMYNDNIGSVLTYYALYKTLTDMKYSVLPIERPLDSPLGASDDAIEFTKKWLPDYAQPVQYKNVFEMQELNKYCDLFMLGSDQLFLESMSANRNHFFFMQWVEENKKKIAYATSFGGPGARGTKEYYRRLEYYVNKFEFLSCRENDGVDFANNELQLRCKVEWCIDPVFLCDKSHYLKLVDSVEKVRETQYVGAYVIIPRPSINKLITKTKEFFSNAPVEVIGDNEKAGKVKEFKYSCKNPFPLEEALELIYNSKFFVTDSFHGVCFAIIFRKDFLVIPRDFTDRFTTLLGKIGLEDRIVNNDFSNFSEDLYKPIDYDVVYTKLDREIETSRKMLSEALVNRKDDVLTDVDVLMKYVRENREVIEELAHADSETKQVVRTIFERLSSIEARISSLELGKK